MPDRCIGFKSLAFMLFVACVAAGCGEEAPVAKPQEPQAKPQSGTVGDAAARGAAWLRAAADKGRFAFDPAKGPDVGMTALALAAVQTVPHPDNREFVQAGLLWLQTMQKADGAIYDKQLAVYCTAAALMAFSAASDPAWAPVLEKGREYLRVAQSDEGEGISQSSENYGGIGYGGSGDINMSTTQFALDAAKTAGLPKDDAYYKKALVFLQRSQNSSESNDQKHTLKDGTTVVPGNDGGGIYRPGDSKAGVQVLPDGRRIFRSYGSMTYALLKSYLLCELDAKDPRVSAALQWISKNWQLDWNPGMEYREKPEQKYEGLFYYYLTLARALSAAEAAKVDLAALGLSAWRQRLAEKLMKMQASDGSWTNPQDRWWEGSPVLCTSYALMALAKCGG
jgi:squalene-hopene/tetraprenyl-beta-curcumene cyclase